MDIEQLFHEVIRIASTSCQKGNGLVLSNGVRLFCHMPHVGPKAWLHVVFPPLDSASIEATEQRVGGHLPEDFKDFLRQANGTMLFSYQLSVWGVRQKMVRTNGDESWFPHDLIDQNMKTNRPDNSPTNIVFFAGADDGDAWCFFEFNKEDYRVGKTERHRFNPSAYWPDFGSWLLSEIQSLQRNFKNNPEMNIDH
jgi:hypothetical protein